jgi:DNA mismatch repair ATPase MutS
MRWSVSLQTEGDREIQLEEVVELADAVAKHDGIATGMGTFSYGIQVVVEAETSDEAVERAQEVLTEAALQAGLPVWPIVSVETIGDDEEMDWYDDIPEGNPL